MPMQSTTCSSNENPPAGGRSSNAVQQQTGVSRREHTTVGTGNRRHEESLDIGYGVRITVQVQVCMYVQATKCGVVRRFSCVTTVTTNHQRTTNNAVTARQ